MNDKQLMSKKKVLVKQVKRIVRPRTSKSTAEEIWRYNNNGGWDTKLLPNRNSY
jgi:hypothetical protein